MLKVLALLVSLTVSAPWAGEDSRAKDVLLTPYLCEDSQNAPTVIVCPGGSYHWLDVKGEGIEVSEWLQRNGVNAFLLQYRTAGFASYFWHYRYVARGHRHPDMICDIQRTIRLIRENASEYGIDADRLGVLGFSAGVQKVHQPSCFT